MNNDDHEGNPNEDKPGCPYCEEDGCEHLLLTVDLNEHCAVGGALYTAFGARQLALVGNAELALHDDDETLDVAIFELCMEELDSFPCDVVDEEFSGGFPGSATEYRSWYCTNESVTARLVMEYQALPSNTQPT